MRNRVMALALAASACAGGPASQPRRDPQLTEAPPPSVAPGQLTVPLERRGDMLFARAQIDGRDVGDFLVDTGASATFLDRRLADEMHLPEVIDAEVGGALADAPASIRELRSLHVAGLRIESKPTFAVDLDDVSPVLGGSVAGIIGFPSIGSSPFAIDFMRASLTVYDPAHFQPPANAKSELLRVYQELPFVEATLANGSIVWLLLDTGASAPITLWHRFVQQYPDVLTVPQKRWVHAMGIGGGTQVMQSELRSVRILGQDYGKTSVLIQDAPPHTWNHPRVAGRVGVELLRRLRVTIHPVLRRIWAEAS